MKMNKDILYDKDKPQTNQSNEQEANKKNHTVVYSDLDNLIANIVHHIIYSTQHCVRINWQIANKQPRILDN